MKKKQMKKQKNSQGITLIALVITIIVLLILAGVTFLTLTGQNGILSKSNKAKEETDQQTATEILNLKITNVQMSKYAEEQRMPTLKELAYFLDPEKDKDIKSVTKTSQKVSSLDWINDNDYSSIFTILKDYPQYEFEIDKNLKLATINGIKIAENETNYEKLENQIGEMGATINSLQTEINTLKQAKGEMQRTKLLTSPVNIVFKEGQQGWIIENFLETELTESIENYKYLIFHYDIVGENYEQTALIPVEELNYTEGTTMNWNNHSTFLLTIDLDTSLGAVGYFKNDKRTLYIGATWREDTIHDMLVIKNIYGIK